MTTKYRRSPAEAKAARTAKVEYLKSLIDSPEASDPGIQRIALERFGSGFSPRNQMLIIMQRPDATKVAGFNAWKSLGRKVSKGAKGISIAVPFTPKADDGALEGEISTKAGRMFFGVGYVFDIADTEPCELTPGAPMTETPTSSGLIGMGVR